MGQFLNQLKQPLEGFTKKETLKPNSVRMSVKLNPYCDHCLSVPTVPSKFSNGHCVSFFSGCSVNEKEIIKQQIWSF